MNISNVHNCYGCGLCAIVCSREIIEIELNADGFYEPVIKDISRCTDCNLCVDVCSYLHDGLALRNAKLKSYGAWSKDSAVRRKCSSGGVGFELGSTFIKKGYKVCGVRYNAEKNQAEHYIATTIEELIPSIGSKYIQSYTVDGFRKIKRKEKYLITGTPCQIDSFRRYIQKFKVEDNFILLDFFCHGVPSKLMWNKYAKEVEKKIGKITYVSWRNKFAGWHDSWAISMDGEKADIKINRHESYNSLIGEREGSYNSRFSQGDVFYRLFLGDTCLGKACYSKCKFKYDRSSADIRIGDSWGRYYNDNDEGVSSVITFSEKGDALLRQCDITLEELPFEILAEGQMKHSPNRPFLFYNVISNLLRNDCVEMAELIKWSSFLNSYNKIKRRLMNPHKTIKNIFRKFSGKK